MFKILTRKLKLIINTYQIEEMVRRSKIYGKDNKIRII